MEKKIRERLAQERRNHQWSQQEVADRIGTTRHNVSRWEAGLTTPGPYFRAKLCKLFGKSAPELGLSEQNPLSLPPAGGGGASIEPPVSTTAPVLALWTVPYGRNPQFTGREEVLVRLAQQFFPQEKPEVSVPRRAALTQPQALKGLGGIGKTQIAVEYAYRAREQGSYTHILWINAGSSEAILSSFVTLAELLPAFAARGETDQQKLVEAIKRWLEQCPQPWLLIFDNADEVSLLQPYLPHHGNGNLLLTTRSHAIGSLAASIEIENMGLAEGTLFLLQRGQRQHACEEEQDEATNIVIALDGFPLALDQAGAYIEETGCRFGEYLQIYHKYHQTLLSRRGKQTTNYPDAVATTWSLSFQKIAQTNPAAAELLHLCAFLVPDAIPEELLTGCATHWPLVLQQAVSDRLAFHHVLEDLLRFSLIKRRVEERMLSLHRLVQVIQQDTMEAGERYQWAERIVRAVHAVFPRSPKEDVHCWPQCLRYLEQAQACTLLIQKHQLLLPEAAELLDRVGIYLSEHASYVLAEPLFQQAHALREVQAVFPLNNLAELYLKQGKYEQAELSYRQTLSILDQHVGAEHSLLANPLNGLASLYWEQGQYTEAEPLYQRALHIWEQNLGPEHPLVARPLNNLANVYREQGRYAEAEPLYQRALHIWEQNLGPEHPDVAYPLNGLANFYYEQGQYVEAEPLYQRALHIWEQNLGPDHPLVAYPLNNLANLYTEQGQYVEAELLYRRALHIREQNLGPDHPLVAYPLDGLADLYTELGQYAKAEPLYQQALHIWEQSQGLEHPQVAYVLNGLANLYARQGKSAEAEPFFSTSVIPSGACFGRTTS